MIESFLFMVLGAALLLFLAYLFGLGIFMSLAWAYLKISTRVRLAEIRMRNPPPRKRTK